MIKRTLVTLAFVAGIFVSIQGCEFYCCLNPQSKGIDRIIKDNNVDSLKQYNKSNCVTYRYELSPIDGWKLS